MPRATLTGPGISWLRPSMASMPAVFTRPGPSRPFLEHGDTVAPAVTSSERSRSELCFQCAAGCMVGGGGVARRRVEFFQFVHVHTRSPLQAAGLAPKSATNSKRPSAGQAGCGRVDLQTSAHRA